MPFLLQPDVPLGEEVRRSLLEQLGHAHAALGDGGSPRAVHEARKACKRVRATARLLAVALRQAAPREVDHLARDAARSLGEVRDADVARAALADLGHPPLPDPEPGARAGAAAAARAVLSRAVEAVEALDLDGVDPSALGAGVRRAWTRARDRWIDAHDSEDDAVLHEWRKAVKALGYQVELLAELAPELHGAVGAELDALQEELGRHHDRALLAARLGDGPAFDVARLEAAVLVPRLRARGGWLFAADPAAFARWLSLHLSGRATTSPPGS
jgi:CHAD domain-containing protein